MKKIGEDLLGLGDVGLRLGRSIFFVWAFAG
jgi:hypothetical protein